MFWTKRLNVVLLVNVEQFSNPSEDHGSVVEEFEGLHVSRFTLASLRQPIIFPSALLLELPVSELLSWQLTYIIE